MPRSLKLWLLACVVLVAAGAALWAWRGGPRPRAGEGAPATVSSPAPAASPKAQTEAGLKVTGNYSNDWMTNCAPLTGHAQVDCEARLSAAYGKTDAAPVPPDKGQPDKPQ